MTKLEISQCMSQVENALSDLNWITSLSPKGTNLKSSIIGLEWVMARLVEEWCGLSMLNSLEGDSMWHRGIAFIYNEMEAKNTELTKHLDECRVCYAWINDDTGEAPICEKRVALQNQYTNLRHRLGINSKEIAWHTWTA